VSIVSSARMTVAAMKNEIGGWENLPGARTRHFKTAVV